MISFSKPNYNGKEIPASGEAVGWMMTSAPLVLVVVVGVYEVLRRGPLTRGNFLKTVSSL